MKNLKRKSGLEREMKDAKMRRVAAYRKRNGDGRKWFDRTKPVTFF